MTQAPEIDRLRVKYASGRASTADRIRLLDLLWELADTATRDQERTIGEEALALLDGLPDSDELRPNLIRASFACMVQRWDRVHHYADIALAAERCARSLYFKAIATAEDWDLSAYGDIAPVVAGHLDEAMRHDDAWPYLYIARARLAPRTSELGIQAGLDIVKAGHERFPDNADLRCDVAQRLPKEQSGEALYYLSPLIEVDAPNCRALTIGVRLLQRTDADRALTLIDELERISDEPWANWDWARGSILVNAERENEALKYFEAGIATAVGDEAVDLWMGIAAVHVELGHRREAVEALLNAYASVFTDFDARWEPLDMRWVGNELITWGELGGVEHDPTFLAVQAWSQGALPIDKDDLMRIGALQGLSRTDGDPNVLMKAAKSLKEPRLLRAAAWAAQISEGEGVLAMEAAVGYLEFLGNAGASEDVLGTATRTVTHVWESLWDRENADEAAKSAVTKTQTKQHALLFKALKRASKKGTWLRSVLPILAEFYRRHWRGWLIEQERHKEALDVVEILSPAMHESDMLFDAGYFSLECGDADKTAGAEMLYRQLVEHHDGGPGAMNNLAVALQRLGELEEAAEYYERAAAAAQGEERDTYLHRAERVRGTLARDEQEQQVRLRAVEQERARREDFLALAPTRWPQLNHWQRQLLCTLSRIRGFDSYEHLAELAGQDVRWVPRHYDRLFQLGMLLELEDGFEINEHVRPLVDREMSHSVYARIVRSTDSIAIKPIFNSRNEYRFYQALLEIFPNNLVFPNMALQAIFSFDRLKPLLDSDTFGYYLRCSVDFCIVSTATYMPLVAFEIDSYWHETERQQERDAMKDRIFETAGGGIGLIRLRPHGRPSEAALRGDVIRAVQEWLAGRPTPAEVWGIDPVQELDLSNMSQLDSADA